MTKLASAHELGEDTMESEEHDCKMGHEGHETNQESGSKNQICQREST